MTAEWPIWRLVTAKVATLTEIERDWCIDDVNRANAVLDMQQAMTEPEE